MNPLEQSLVAWDRSAFLAVNHGMASPLLDAVMPRISDLGLGHVQVLALLAVALFRGRSVVASCGVSVWGKLRLALLSQRAWLAPMLAALALSGIGATVVKHTVSRDRPAWFYTNSDAGKALNVKVRTIPGLRPLRVRGFLSGHTATSIALATTATLLLWRRRRRALLTGIWLLAISIGFSRVYVADHWPLDVAAGAALGMVCGFAAYQFLIDRATGRRAAAAPDRSSRSEQVSQRLAEAVDG